MSAVIETAKVSAYAVVGLVAVAAGWLIASAEGAVIALALVLLSGAAVFARYVTGRLNVIEGRMLTRAEFRAGAGGAADEMSQEHGILDGHIRYVSRGVDRMEDDHDLIKSQQRQLGRWMLDILEQLDALTRWREEQQTARVGAADIRAAVAQEFDVFLMDLAEKRPDVVDIETVRILKQAQRHREN